MSSSNHLSMAKEKKQRQIDDKLPAATQESKTNKKQKNANLDVEAPNNINTEIENAILPDKEPKSKKTKKSKKQEHVNLEGPLNNGLSSSEVHNNEEIPSAGEEKKLKKKKKKQAENIDSSESLEAYNTNHKPSNDLLASFPLSPENKPINGKKKVKQTLQSPEKREETNFEAPPIKIKEEILNKKTDNQRDINHIKKSEKSPENRPSLKQDIKNSKNTGKLAHNENQNTKIETVIEEVKPSKINHSEKVDWSAKFTDKLNNRKSQNSQLSPGYKGVRSEFSAPPALKDSIQIPSKDNMKNNINSDKTQTELAKDGKYAVNSPSNPKIIQQSLSPINIPSKQMYNETIKNQSQIVTTDNRQRVKSFDGGKTERINPDDSFETRSRVWEIRKKEKLMHQEKKQLRKQVEECTFNPLVNKNSLVKFKSAGNFLQRSAEWTQKVRASIQNKSDKLFEESRKSEIVKNRIKPYTPVASEYKSNKVSETQNGSLRAIQFGQTNNEHPAIKENLNDKLTEIHTIFENVSATIKTKSARRVQAVEESQKIAKIKANEEKQRSHYNQTKSTKVITVPSSDDTARIASLKGIMNIQKKKEAIHNTNKPFETDGSEVFLTETENAQDILKRNSKHLEIRNNRYVMIDNNLSAIERKELESNDVSLNFEAVQ